jgi:hypothetical protein
LNFLELLQISQSIHLNTMQSMHLNKTVLLGVSIDAKLVMMVQLRLPIARR